MIERTVWKRRVGTVTRWIPRARSRKVALLYHAVGSGPWAMPVDRFREQMQWLANATRVVSLSAMFDADQDEDLSVAITFDDGYSSVHDEALPVLARLQLSGTVYLNTGWIGDDEARPAQPELGHYPGETFMRWKQVDALRRADWTIGSHGVDHLDLTRMPPEQCGEQLARSRADIANRTGSDCVHFAYTWGRHTPQLRSLVSQCGYRYAAGGFHGPLGSNFDPLAFPRIAVSRDYSLDDFKAIVRGDWDYLGWVHRAKGWVA